MERQHHVTRKMEDGRWKMEEVKGKRKEIIIQKKERLSLGQSLSEKVAASYSPTLHCSTIGAGGLNFSVRNGKRWDPAAITT